MHKTRGVCLPFVRDIRKGHENDMRSVIYVQGNCLKKMHIPVYVIYCYGIRLDATIRHKDCSHRNQSVV